MSATEIEQYFRSRNFDLYGHMQGKSGRCYLVGSVRDTYDAHDKQRRTFYACPVDQPQAEFVTLAFGVSNTALATERVTRLIADPEAFLLSAGLLRMRELLAEDDQPGIRREVELNSRSEDKEFRVIDARSLREEHDRVALGVLELLWAREYSGAGERTPYADVEAAACTSKAMLDGILKRFATQKMVESVNLTSGIRITEEGERELERRRASALKPPPAAAVASPLPTTAHPEWDVFLCHSTDDKAAVVEPLHAYLVSHGIRSWLDREAIGWGDSLIAKIQNGLGRARFVIVVVSATFVNKKWGRAELEAALTQEIERGRKFVLPLLVGDPASLLADLPFLKAKRYLIWSGLPEEVERELRSILVADINQWT